MRVVKKFFSLTRLHGMGLLLSLPQVPQERDVSRADLAFMADWGKRLGFFEPHVCATHESGCELSTTFHVRLVALFSASRSNRVHEAAAADSLPEDDDDVLESDGVDDVVLDGDEELV